VDNGSINCSVIVVVVAIVVVVVGSGSATAAFGGHLGADPNGA